jgi:type I restriction enzyme S subunit
MDQALQLPKHNDFQQTGVPWLGEIPSHWELKRNKHLFTEQKATVGKNASEYTLLSLTLKGVIARDMENPQGKFPAEFNTYKIVKPDDLIFCLFDIEETPRTIGRAQQDGMITGAYTVMQCQPVVSARYLSYYYLSLDYDKRLKPLYTGLRNVIQRDTFMRVKTPLPPRDEQDRIANFLDQKTTEIDEAIAKKQRLIELLKEQKAILVNQAVTKGLNPEASMSDSGVEWIGEVPDHWVIKRLRAIGTTQNGISAGAEYFGSGFPFVSYSDVYNHRELPKEVQGLAKSSELDKVHYSVKKGDVFFTRTSETAEEIGFSSTCMETIENATFAGFLIRFRPVKDYLLPGWSKYYFSAQIHRNYFVGNMNLVIRASLSQMLLKGLPVLIPPKDEQERIFSHLEAISEEIDKGVSLQQQQIKQLQEYKTALVANAVTGKIKL